MATTLPEFSKSATFSANLVQRVMSTNEDIIAMVLSYLPVSQLLHLSSTCSTWHRIVLLVQKRRRYIKWLRVQIQSPQDLNLYARWFDELSIKPVLVIMLSDFCPYSFDVFQDEQILPGSDWLAERSKLIFLKLLRQKIPSDCLLLGTNSSHPITTSSDCLTTHASATRAATDFNASCLMVPKIPGCTMRQFNFTDDELSAFMIMNYKDVDILSRLSIPVDHEGDCVVLLFYNDEITYKDSSTKWFARMLRRELRVRGCYNLTFIGGRVDLLQPGLQTVDYEPCVAGVVICGANVSAASVVLPKCVTKLDQADAYVDKLLACDVWQNSSQKTQREVAGKSGRNKENVNMIQNSSTMFAVLFDQYGFLNSDGTCNMLAKKIHAKLNIPVLGYAGMETVVTGCDYLPKTEKFIKKRKIYFKDMCRKTFDHGKGGVMLVVSLLADAF